MKAIHGARRTRAAMSAVVLALAILVGSPVTSVAGAADGSAPSAPPAGPASAAPASVGGSFATTIAYARAFRFGPRTRKVVALTFDDGYSPRQTRAIFNILRADHVMATFFPYARAMYTDPSLWHEIAAAGYPIGNHTYSHANLTYLSTAAAISELTHARATIAHITGRAEPAIMRPPYGAYTLATRHAAALAGYPTVVLWDVDTRDWSGISSSTIVARAIVGTRGSIVLMHAGPANTPSALARIIADYRARGYGFVTVPQLLGIAWH